MVNTVTYGCLKQKFKVPSEKYETKGESIKFNTPDIEASFTTRKKDNLWKADFVGTEESAAAKTWFTAVPEKGSSNGKCIKQERREA